MAANLACDKFWVNKNIYHDAEKKYQECAVKLQRRLEIFGGKSEETNNKRINNSKNLKKLKKNLNNVDVNELKKELLHLEAQENAKNQEFHSQTHPVEMTDESKDDSNFQRSQNFSDSEKNKEQKEKKNKNEKKLKRNRENEDLLGGVGMTKIDEGSFPKTSLAGEVAKARQHIKSSLECMETMNGVGNLTNPRLTALLEKMEKAIENLTMRVEVLERNCAFCKRPGDPDIAVCPAKPQAQPDEKKTPVKEEEEEDDIDLFSDSEEEDEAAKKIREQRLAEYAAKKSKKPALVAKSNIILDIKPWDDETDMKEMEKAVRAIEMDGLVWGASKLVPVAFKIFKLQISCVIEDDKVSVDLLTETLESIEDYIQSVDIAAFNKV